MKGPGVENELSKRASEMKIPSQYDNSKNYGKKSKIVARKINVCAKGLDHKCYGSRAIMTKENKMTFTEFLLQEGDDITNLPDKAISEIKKKIREGAADLTQQWMNALELVHRAYHVLNIRRPLPDEKGAWRQYEDLIKYGVQQLSATRGLDGKWRSSTVLAREAFDDNRYPDSGMHIGTHRFFVEIPGQAAVEADAKSMDDIIEKITNKIRNSHEVKGTKVRVEERTKTYAVLTVWVNDVKRDRIIIKDIS